MASQKKPNGELVIQTIAMPKDTNRHGDIFGGWLVAQMDLGSAILASKIAKARVVTVAIEQMAFLQPVHVGDPVACAGHGACAELLPELPEVPTARSLGWPEMEKLAAWSALAGPPRLPREVVERWSDALAKLSRDPGWRDRNEKLGGISAIRTPAQTEAFVRDQYQLYEGLALRLGLRAQ